MDRWDSVRAVKRTLCSFLSQFFVFAISSKFGIARTISPQFFRFRLSIFGQQFDKRFKNENIGRSEQMVNTDERRQFTCNLQKWESNDFFSVSSLSSISVAYFFFFGLAYFRSARPNVFLCFSFKYIPVLISKYTTHSIGDDGFFNSRFGAYVIIVVASSSILCRVSLSLRHRLSLFVFAVNSFFFGKTRIQRAFRRFSSSPLLLSSRLFSFPSNWCSHLKRFSHITRNRIRAINL